MTEGSAAEIELARERHYGGEGTIVVRPIPCIDLANFDRRFDDIADEIWAAGVEVGFFQVVNHGVELEQVDAAFDRADALFGLPTEQKRQWAMPANVNAGWEDRAQVRPSTGTPDQKQTFQITDRVMDAHALWPDEHAVPRFRSTMDAFAASSHRLGMRILSCIAARLGFEHDFFSARHDPMSPHFQCTLRLLHYHAADNATSDVGLWWAGAHTDYDCLTLLYQRAGESGLEICPGTERESGAWTPVPPTPGVVTCNIGDMLMRWSDDQLQSTLHRVRRSAASQGARRSIAYFCQADGDAVIEGPGRLYPAITAAGHLQERIAANFASLATTQSESTAEA